MSEIVLLAAVIVGIVVGVGLAVGVVERRQDMRRTGRGSAWDWIFMAGRRPAPLRVQLIILIVVASVIVALALFLPMS